MVCTLLYTHKPNDQNAKHMWIITFKVSPPHRSPPTSPKPQSIGLQLAIIKHGPIGKRKNTNLSSGCGLMNATLSPPKISYLCILKAYIHWTPLPEVCQPPPPPRLHSVICSCADQITDCVCACVRTLMSMGDELLMYAQTGYFLELGTRYRKIL